jgi:alpha-L-fucosidase
VDAQGRRRHGRDLYNWLMARKPGLVVNERVERERGLGDFLCPEQAVPAAPLERPWDTCATMNGSWGYSDWAENNYRSVKDLLQEMVMVVSRDGNYLLNIGPKCDGSTLAIVRRRTPVMITKPVPALLPASHAKDPCSHGT